MTKPSRPSKRAKQRLASRRRRSKSERTVFTVGHSTRPVADFIRLLQCYGVTLVIDVRKMPRSRANPQYNRETLPKALGAAGIGYVHVAGLGGLRRPQADSPNRGWRNRSFQAYADYMQTPEFQENLAMVLELAATERPVLMCAEAVPWRCHRSLIGDALVARGIAVCDILNETRHQVHALKPWARVSGTRVSYPPEASSEIVPASGSMRAGAR
jgi:uncharacterized protein (DUF488 family)